MTRRIFLIPAALLLLLSFLPASARGSMQTVRFVQRDTCDLYMDIHSPTGPSEGKPTVVFVFGGGFIDGSRNDPYYRSWFDLMTDEGYRVVSIDYRLALKGKKLKPVRDRAAFLEAVDTAVEDLFSATRYLLDHAGELGIDPENIVTMGSSAGALTVLSADWELSNRTSRAAVLPESFRYAGVVSLSGAILSDRGKPSYRRAPAPTLLLHGTADGIVAYKGIRFFRWGMFGSYKLANIYKSNNYNYSIIRCKDNTHEIANSLPELWDYVSTFLRRNVVLHEKYVVDVLVEDPSIRRWTSGNNVSDLYD